MNAYKSDRCRIASVQTFIEFYFSISLARELRHTNVTGILGSLTLLPQRESLRIFQENLAFHDQVDCFDL